MPAALIASRLVSLIVPPAPSQRQELAGHPFPWSPTTHALPPCAWLQHLGLHAPGSASASAWARECPCGGPATAPWGSAALLLQQLWRDGSGEAGAASVSREEVQQRLGGWLGLTPGQMPCLLSRVRAMPAVVDRM